MKIAVIGGGASGMVSAYLLDKQGHHVTVFERQPMLGGHIWTLLFMRALLAYGCESNLPISKI
jgi:phytoene dehydrogenase-like protein